MLCGVPAHVDGRMIGITAQTAGASVINEDRMWHYVEGIKNWSPIWTNHAIRILPGPSSLWLDARGRRLPVPLFPGFDSLGALAHTARAGDDHSWFLLNERIIGREFAITGLRSIASAQGFTIEASQFGKIKMVTQVAAITFLILGMPGDSPNPTFQKLGNFMLYVVVVFAVVSAVDYFRRFWTKIDDRFKAKQRRRLILLEKRQRRQLTARHVPTRDVPTH